MTYRWIMAAKRSGGRQRGNIEERGGALRVRLYAGTDPVTRRQVYLRATVPGTDKAAYRKADDKLSEFRTQVLKQRSAASAVPFSHAIDEWLRTSEIEASTRMTYLGYITNHIKPVLGSVPVKKLDVRTLESFYTELRRRRIRCDGKPFTVHKSADDHDCGDMDCQRHRARLCPPRPSSRFIRSSAARWQRPNAGTGSTATRPSSLAAHAASHPSPTHRPQPRRAASSKRPSGWTRTEAPSSGRHDHRHAPKRLCGLRFARVDLDAEVIDLRRNGVLGAEKDQDPPEPPNRPRLRSTDAAPQALGPSRGPPGGAGPTIHRRPVRVQQREDTRPLGAVLPERRNAAIQGHVDPTGHQDPPARPSPLQRH
jgi:integrase